jgi:hypothetical protein
MYVAVKSAKPLEDYKLQIKFKNGEEKIFDLTPYLVIGKFAELRDISLFNTVTVKFDSIAWANQLDLDPEFIYAHSIAIKPRVVRQTTRAAKKQVAR